LRSIKWIFDPYSGNKPKELSLALSDRCVLTSNKGILMLKKYFIFLLLGFSWVFIALPFGMAETPNGSGTKEVTVHKSPY